MLGKIDCFGMTDIRCKRPKNEDQFLIADLNKSLRLHQSSLSINDYETLFGRSQGQLFLVADGMGGHAAGERASHLAVETVTANVLNTMPWFFRLDSDRDDDLREELAEGLLRCQAAMRAAANREPQHEGMGTTLTMPYLICPRLSAVHVGDSRCYIHREGDLKQITKDHTFAQQIQDSRALDSEEIDDRWHNTLWNYIGGDSDELKPEVSKAQLRLGDTVLLCTDGLTKHVSDEAICAFLGEDLPANDVSVRLVNAAKEDGGSDNITVVVVRFLETQPATTLPDQQAAEQVEGKSTPLAETTLGVATQPGADSLDDLQPEVISSNRDLPGKTATSSRSMGRSGMSCSTARS